MSRGGSGAGPWTDELIGVLLDLDDMNAREAGEEIGRRTGVPRSRGSVLAMRRKVRNGWAPMRERYTEDERDFIRATPHMTTAQVAKGLGVSKDRASHLRRAVAQAEGISFGTANKSPHMPGPRRLLAKSCIGCGYLLDGSFFSRTGSKSRSWSTRCTRCQSHAMTEKWQTEPRKRNDAASNRASVARLQAFTKDRATRSGQPWLESDHLILRDPELTNLEKAIRTKRTYIATTSAVSRNGYTSRVGKGDPLKGQWQIHFPNAPKRDAA